MCGRLGTHNFQLVCHTHSPCYVIVGDVEENKEALVIGREGFVGMKDRPSLSHSLQVQQVNTDLLSNGRRMQRVGYNTFWWPGTTVDEQVPTSTHKVAHPLNSV